MESPQRAHLDALKITTDSAPVKHDTPLQPSRRQRLLRGLVWSVGAVLLISLAAWSVANVARERALSDLREIDAETMTLVVSNLRTKLQRLEIMPQMVARDERIKQLLRASRDPAVVEAANRYLEDVNRTVGALETYVMDVTGLTVAASNWSSERSFVGENFGFRPYFRDALEGLSGRYFARGAASLTRGYYFACPIHRDGEVVGVAAVKIGLEDIEQTWRELPGRIVLTDWHGVVFASNQPLWRYRTLRRLDQRTLESIRESRRYPGIVLDPVPLVEIEPIDGSSSWMTVSPAASYAEPVSASSTRYLALSENLPEYGWMVYTMSSPRTLRATTRAAAVLGAFSAGLLILAIFYLAQRRQCRHQRASFQQRERDMLRRNKEELEQKIEERTRDVMLSNRQLQREIAEHEIAERALRDTQQGLIQTAKLAALGQLAAGVTHELNQPLTALRSYAANTRLLIERGQTAEAVGNLDRMSRLTDRMAGITGHLKTFARKTEPDQQQVVDVAHTMKAALALVGIGRPRTNIVVQDRAPGEALVTTGDPIRLEQVFVNLINNAREALEDVDRRELYVDYRSNGARIEIEIRDSGPGIRPEDMDSVFDPFFTTKEVGKGLGLGLSISSGIVDEMGGSVRVHNHPDGGAVFTVELPRAEAEVRMRSA